MGEPLAEAASQVSSMNPFPPCRSVARFCGAPGGPADEALAPPILRACTWK